MRAGGGADDVEGVVDVRDPVAQRLVHRVLERLRAALDRAHLGAEQLHAEHVGRLPLDIARAHEDHAGQAEARGDGGGGDAVLAGAGLGDDPRLAHADGEQDLADAIVDLVRAGMVEFVALEIDFRAVAGRRALADRLGQPLGEVKRAGAADIMLHQPVELGGEGGIGLRAAILLLEFEDQRHQRLGDVAAAELAEMPLRIGLRAEGVGDRHSCGDRLEEAGDLVHILDAGRAFDARRHVEQPRAGDADRLGDVAPIEPAGQRPGQRVGEPSSRRQSKRSPMPPGRSAAAGVLAS